LIKIQRNYFYGKEHYWPLTLKRKKLKSGKDRLNITKNQYLRIKYVGRQEIDKMEFGFAAYDRISIPSWRTHGVSSCVIIKIRNILGAQL